MVVLVGVGGGAGIVDVLYYTWYEKTLNIQKTWNSIFHTKHVGICVMKKKRCCIQQL